MATGRVKYQYAGLCALVAAIWFAGAAAQAAVPTPPAAVGVGTGTPSAFAAAGNSAPQAANPASNPSLYPRVPAPAPGKLPSGFHVADVNRDGCVDAAEFAAFEKAAGLATDATDLRVQKLKQPAMKFWGSFANSIMMIIVTELGDKTFFIAAILAMQFDRSPVYSGAIGALALMTVLSAAIGWALPAILPRSYTHYMAVGLFAYFGVKLLREARDHDESEPNEELEEAERELGVKDEDLEKGSVKASVHRTNWSVLSQAFTLTFLAEWGDRSQIATIALATTKDPIGVTLGGILGHALCTGIAVLGGKMLSTKISERTVLLSGGVLFLLFAVHGVWVGSDNDAA